MEANIIKIIENVGFPIAITMYLLIRMEGKIDQLSDSIKGLTKIISSKI
ncbi:YvrJ family protein [Peptostreptococcus equinus]|uniref:YvrJ family protein n=1 Tax=Peptostreptococcus equinus TaxID=3003601 RepID=A0ABY7JR11_9FIRM|nr:YvrJ family protein [Peptostreptococcus sp. CBA3647]WAW14387.1 YvrJ family protein [Peptostreptococcus sp. CBA3647]